MILRAIALAAAALMLGAAAEPEPAPVAADAPNHCEWRPIEQTSDISLFCQTQFDGWAPVWTPRAMDRDTVAKAKAGDPAAMASLGSFYLSAPKGVYDAAAASDWLHRAADKNSALAMVYLVMLYGQDRDAPRDEGQAARWLKAALEANDPEALASLGGLYASGAGVPVNLAETMRLYRLAADKGWASAWTRLGGLYDSGQGVARDDAEALRLYRLGADKGDAGGLVGEGFMVLNGRGAPRDEAKAMALFRQAAALGDGGGMAAVGLMVAEGRGVKKDPAEAVRWYRMGAAKSNAMALYLLGRAYAEGQGVRRDDAEAGRWLRRSTSYSYAPAIAYLGYLLNHGRSHDQPGLSWASLPSALDMDAVFPIEAAAADISGEVIYLCKLDAQLRPGECQVISETPAGWGFGAAGMTLMSRVRLQSGLEPGAMIHLPIRFPMGGWNSSRAFDDKCAAYALAMDRSRRLSPIEDWYSRYWPARSRHDAITAGQADTPDRLAAAVQRAAQRLSSGHDDGVLRACQMK